MSGKYILQVGSPVCDEVWTEFQKLGLKTDVIPLSPIMLRDPDGNELVSGKREVLEFARQLAAKKSGNKPKTGTTRKA